jgi:hypothetical protein
MIIFIIEVVYGSDQCVKDAGQDKKEHESNVSAFSIPNQVLFSTVYSSSPCLGDV